MVTEKRIKHDVKYIEAHPYVVTVSSIRKGKYHVASKPFRTSEGVNKFKSKLLKSNKVMAFWSGKVELGEAVKKVR